MRLKSNVISVILPVYNAGKFLAECLDSLASQTHEDLQIIAIDDKSRDDSYKILKSFQKKINGLEVYKNKKHYGMSICYNRGVKRAKGQFITFLNANDVNSPNRLKRQINFLLQDPKTVAVGTQYTKINEDCKKIERISLPQTHEIIYDNLLHTESVCPETVMINRLLIPKDLLYFKSNKYPFIFNEVFAKFFQYGTVANIGQSLYFHRVGVKRNHRKISKLEKLTSTVLLGLTSWAEYDYRPSLRSLLIPLARQI